jgi:hypothetical protein
MIGHEPLELLTRELAFPVRMMQQRIGFGPPSDRRHQRGVTSWAEARQQSDAESSSAKVRVLLCQTRRVAKAWSSRNAAWRISP